MLLLYNTMNTRFVHFGGFQWQNHRGSGFAIFEKYWHIKLSLPVFDLQYTYTVLNTEYTDLWEIGAGA